MTEASLNNDMATNEAMVHIPTWRDKMWRWLGFNYHLGEEPQGSETMPGWAMTDVKFQFNKRDRIRLLFSGKLSIKVVMYAKTELPERMRNRVDWRIKRPGEPL